MSQTIRKLLEGFYQLSGDLVGSLYRFGWPHHHDKEVERRVKQAERNYKKAAQGYSHKVREYKLRISELEELIAEDRLTHLSNRHGLDMKLPVAVSNLARSKRNGEYNGISAIMIDLDHFKQVNDRYGHQAGDQVLVELAERLLMFRKHRPSDIVCRLGGEEFLIVLPGAGVNEAYRQAMLFASVVRTRPFVIRMGEKSIGLPVTVSIGVAETEVSYGDTADSVWTRLYQQSDKALYRAKHGGTEKSGRDQVVSYDSSLE